MYWGDLLSFTHSQSEKGVLEKRQKNKFKAQNYKVQLLQQAITEIKEIHKTWHVISVRIFDYKYIKI